MAPRVVIAVNDLMFAPRLLDAAKRLGVEAMRAGTPEAAVEACRGAERAAVVVDLHDERLRPRELFQALRGEGNVVTIGYYGHLEPHRAEEARAAGCTMTFTRGQLVGQLDDVLRRALQ